MSTKQLVSVALAGLVAGATLGILFAPDKGEKTRKKLKKKGKELQKKAGRQYEDAMSALQNSIETVKEKAVDLTENVKETANSVKNKFTNA